MPSGPLRGLPDRSAKGTTARAPTPQPKRVLLGAAQNDLRRHARRARRDVGQRITRERERSALLSPSPVRKRAALDPEDEELACLILLNAVGSEVGNAPLGDVPA